MTSIYEQAARAVYEAGYPKQAVWKIPPNLQTELLQTKNAAGEYVVSHFDQRYHLLGYPVEIVTTAAGLTLDVIEPGQVKRPGPSEVK